MPFRPVVLAFLTLTLFMLPSPSLDAATVPPPQTQAAVEVVDIAYAPQTIRVTVGTTITWTNAGRIPHTVTADDDSFDSERLNTNQTFSYTFDTAGTFGYYCVFHGAPGSGQFGTVEVVAPDPPPPPPPDGGAYCPPGKAPEFVLGFADLKALLGDTMGVPLECEHANPENGDALQQTTTGLAFYRKSTNTPTFTNGFEHWALTSQGLVYWVGDSIDPPANVGPPPTDDAP